MRRALSDGDLRAHHRVRFDVYVNELQWVDVGQCAARQELDEYDARQAEHIVAYRGSEPIGALRVLKNGDLPLPVERDPFSVAISGDWPSVEISRLAVAAEIRGTLGPLLAMFRLGYGVATEVNAGEIYALVERPLHLMLRRLGFAFRPLTPPLPYFGGEVMATVIRTEDVIPSLRKVNDNLASFFEAPFDGLVNGRFHGLAVSSAIDSEFVAPGIAARDHP